MKQAINDLKNDLEENKNYIDNVYEFAIKQVEQNYKREKFIVKILSLFILILLLINGFLVYQFTTTTVLETVEYTQDGDWNAIAEDGSMVNGDYTYGETTQEEN